MQAIIPDRITPVHCDALTHRVPGCMATRAREQISVRIPRETKLEIERLAEADRRGISAVAELLLNAALKARGQQTAEAR